MEASPSLVKPVTFSELLTKLEDIDIPDKELAPYFKEDPHLSRNLAPGICLNPALVETGPVIQGAGAMDLANSFCRWRRRVIYERKLKTHPDALRIVAEGDSWFQYPFLLTDIIDVLMAKKEYAVRCFSEAGDTLRVMARKKQYRKALEDKRVKVFLLSAGGNDLVEGNGVRRFLNSYQPGRKLQDYKTAKYDVFLKGLEGYFKSVISDAFSVSPRLKVFLHGYSYPVPQPKKGKWLGKPMAGKPLEIVEPELQYQIVKMLLDDFNAMLKRVVKEFPKGKVIAVNLLAEVPKKGWHDEFHPDDLHYGKVAKVISDQIKKGL